MNEDPISNQPISSDRIFTASPYETYPPGWGATSAPVAPNSKRRSVGTVLAAGMLSAVAAAGSTLGVLHFTDGGPAVAYTSTPITATAVSQTTTSMSALLAKVEPGVVTISTTGFSSYSRYGVQQEEGAGTGMVLTSDGVVLTNAHVVADASTISVKVPGDENKTYKAAVLGVNTERDVAVLKLTDASQLTTVTLGSSEAMQVGDPVVAIGNALALPGGPTVTTGIISAVDRSIQDDTTTLNDLFQTDAAINPGNSGGALVNSAGEVIGMNTAVSSDAQNIGFALSIDSIKDLITQLENGQGGDSLVAQRQTAQQYLQQPMFSTPY